MPAPETPPYAYRCTDRSIFLTPYRRYWVTGFASLVPRWMPANFVTLGSSLCMWLLLSFAVQRDAFAPTTLALIFTGLIQVYLIYDHVDGMQAKRTGTSSALGEFLDHSLDVYHAAISTLAIFALVGFENRVLVLVMLWLGHLAFAATMVEEKERGELYFGPIGSLEGVMLFTAFFLSWTFPAAREWWMTPLAFSLPAYWLLVISGGVGSVVAVLDCLRRIGRVPVQFTIFAVTSLVLALWLARSPLPFWSAVAALVLFCGDFTGRVLGSHLLGQRAAWPDLVTPILVVAAWAWPVGAPGISTGLLGYLVARTLVGVFQILYQLRMHWRWKNPRDKAAPCALPHGALAGSQDGAKPQLTR